jgi:hypothetical protein
MTLHLCFPRKLGDWSVVVLVALDVEACELEGKTIENVDNATFDVAFRGQAVVGIVPRPVHGAVDPFDKTQFVAAEERRTEDAVPGTREQKACRVIRRGRSQGQGQRLGPCRSKGSHGRLQFPIRRNPDRLWRHHR